MTSRPVGSPLPLALFLLSATVIAYQLVILQILSIGQWHYLASLVIAIALLGFGLSGTVLSLSRSWWLARLEPALATLALTAALVMTLLPVALFARPIRFDTYLLFHQADQWGRLVLTVILLMLPFFLAAMVIGLAFVAETANVGRLYAANLIGSGLGGAFGLALLSTLPSARLPGLVALPAVAAAWLLIPKASRRRGRLLTGLALVTIAWQTTAPVTVPLSQYKDLAGLLNLPGAAIVAERPGIQGLVQIARAEGLRSAPGLSLTYRGPIPVRSGMFLNGDGLGPLPLTDLALERALHDHTTDGAVHALFRPEQVLLFHDPTGIALARALAHDASRIVTVGTLATASALADRHLGQDSPFRSPKARLVTTTPRTYLAAETDRFDLIRFPDLGAFGGGSGLFALQEEPLLTREGVSAAWDRLTPDGILTATVWHDRPARRPLRITTLLFSTLKTLTPDPWQHLVIIRGWATQTILVKRSPFTAADTARLQAFCTTRQFDILAQPGGRAPTGQPYHAVSDDRYVQGLDLLRAGRETELYRNDPFRLTPPTDDRPFFSQFLRWRSLFALTGLYGSHGLPFIEVGYFLLAGCSLVLLAAALVLILLPLGRLGWTGRGRGRVVAYFGGLGTGYMLTEIVFIHRLSQYLGHPAIATALVVGTLLTASGLGSALSQRLDNTSWSPRRATLAVTLLLLGSALLLEPILGQTLGWPLSLRCLLAILLTGLPGFAMGMPFPLALRTLGATNATAVPWAWGINGCLSVTSSLLATILAVEFGFLTVSLVAVCAYLTAAASNVSLNVRLGRKPHPN